MRKQTSLYQAAQAREDALATYLAEVDACHDAVRAMRRHVYLGCLVLDRTPADVMLALELGVPPALVDGGVDRDEATFERSYQHFTEMLRKGLAALDAPERGGEAAPDQAPASRVLPAPPDQPTQELTAEGETARMLVLAQAKADRMVDDAKAYARTLDHDEGQVVVDTAVRRAQEITAEARLRAGLDGGGTIAAQVGDEQHGDAGEASAPSASSN